MITRRSAGAPLRLMPLPTKHGPVVQNVGLNVKGQIGFGFRVRNTPEVTNQTFSCPNFWVAAKEFSVPSHGNM